MKSPHAFVEPLEPRIVLAVFNVSGVIASGSVWAAGDVQRITADATLAAGATLTIEPGAIIQFNSGNNLDLFIEGNIVVPAGSGKILFTSTRDDTGFDGIAGTADDLDTEGNDPTTGASGQWGVLRFGSSSTGTLRNIDVRYGGNTDVPFEVLIESNVTIAGGVVRNSASNGLRITASNPTLTNFIFQNNAGAAASMDLASNPTISGVTMSGNAVNALNLDAGSLSANRVWDDADIVYRLTGDVTVPAGRTLTLGAGQIVKAAVFSEPGLIVAGTLLANGTAARPVIFTSDKDDAAGGDTLNDGAQTLFGGESGGVRFLSGSTGTLDSFEVRYAGDPFVRPAMTIDNANVAMRGGAIVGSGQIGIRIVNSDPVLAGVKFQNGEGAAISMDLASNPAIAAPEFINNRFNGLTLDGGTLDGGTLDGGTLAENGVWDDTAITYRIPPGGITVPAGRTLTIAPGMVVKAAPNQSAELFVDGTLIADGTLAAPIIFTSDRDDSAGGDLNNNGPSNGAFFDWQALRFRTGSSGTLDHIDVRFAGANVPGAITASGATVTMTNSIVRGSASAAVAVQSSATVTLQNNLLLDSANGIRIETGATVQAANNTIDGNQTGVAALGGTITLTSSLVTNSTGPGISASGGTVTMSFNDVFANAGGNYTGLASQTGTNGNTSADPKYFNRTNCQFQLRAGSPAIDAATSVGALATDFLGNPRFDDPNVVNLGSGTQPFFDMGAFERQETSTSDIDLRAALVSGPATGLQAQQMTVTWSVENLGPASATGSWFDAVYLSTDRIFSPDDFALGELQHTGDLGAGASYSASKLVTLPGVLPGDYFFIVRTNARHEVFEAQALVNNAAAATQPIAMDLPTLTLGAPFGGTLPATGSALFYKLNAPAGADLALTLDGPNSGFTNELYLSFGDLPSRQSFDARGIRPNLADQSVSIASTQAGQYFVMVHGEELSGAESFTLSASLAGFGINGISPARGSNTGQVTLAISGSQFAAGSQPRLIDNAGQTILPAQVFFTDSGLLSATFDLTGRAVGLADVQVVNSGSVTTTLPDALNIVVGGEGRLVTSFTAPDRVRVGRDFRIVIEYTNAGDTDLLAPVMHLGGLGFSTLSFSPDLSDGATGLDVIAVNPSGPAGILPPGAHGTITIYGGAIGSGDERFDLRVAQYPAEAINWAAISPLIRPAEVEDTEWNPLFTQLQANVGDTWGDFARVISRDATLLPAALGLNESLRDVLQLELNRAFADLNPGISGRAFLGDTNHPLANAEIRLFDATTNEAFFAVSLTDGTYFVPAVLPGSYEISFDGLLPVGAATVTMGTSDINALNLIATPAATLSGAVFLTPLGVPARNVLVTATSVTGESFASVTDDNGLYTITSLPTGDYTVLGGGGTFAFAEVNAVHVDAGAARAHVNLGVEIGSTIKGHLTGPGGAISGATIAALGADGETLSATTNASGDYEIPNLRGQLYTVRATKTGLVAGEIDDVNLTAGQTVSGVNLSLLRAGTVQGTVTGTGGAPVGAVLVSALAGATSFTALTDAAGHYVFDQLPAGSYSISTGASTLMTVTHSVSVAAGATVTDNLSLTARGTIAGRVSITGSGAPLSGVTVFFTNADGPVASTVTNASGDYSFPAIDAGAYQVVLGDLGTAGIAKQSVSITPAQPTVTPNFSVPVAGTIAGTIRAANGSTALADTEVSLILDGNVVATMQSDATGHYSFVVLNAGTYSIEAAGDAQFFAPVTGLVVSGGANLSGRDLEAGDKVIAGTVTDLATGLPLANATVIITRDDASDSTSAAVLMTAADGSFSFPGAVAGTFRVLAFASGHGFAAQTATITSGAANVALALPVEFVLRGTIANAGAAGAVVTLSGAVDASVATDATGAFAFHSLNPGNYDISVTAPGREATVLRDVPLSQPNQVLNAALTASSTQVHGIVRSAAGPIAGALVAAADANGFVLARAVSAADGTYVLDTLPAGSFTIIAAAADYVLSTPLAATVAQGSNITIADFILTAGAISDPPPGAPAADSEGGVIFKGLFTKPVRQPADPTISGLPGVCPEVAGTFPRSVHAKALNDAFKRWESEYADTDLDRIASNVLPKLIDLNIARLEKTFTVLSGLVKTLGGKKTKQLDKFLTSVVNEIKRVKIDMRAALAAQTEFSGIFALKTALDGADRIRTTVDVLGFASLFLEVQSSSFGKQILIDAAIKGLKAELVEAEKTSADLLAQVRGLTLTALVATRITSEEAAYQNALGNAVIDLQSRLITECSCAEAHGPAPAPRAGLFAALVADFCPVAPKPAQPLGGASATPGANDAPDSQLAGSSASTFRSSFDPNDKHGPAGFGANGFIRPGVMPFEVEFENIGQIAAQIVQVTDTLDADFDLATFEFTGFGFSNRTFTVPAGLTHYETTLDLRPDGVELLVPVVLDLNTSTRVVTATFSTLDPFTLRAPDGFEGFLPPDDANHNGEGFFTYTVSAKNTLATGTTITNQASIVFDSNAPILTPTTLNTIDADAPASTVNALPATSTRSSFVVSWTASDAASGVAGVSLFFTDNDGPLQTATLTDADGAFRFTGQLGHSYKFFTQAIDHVGNIEALAAVPDAQIAIVAPTLLTALGGKFTLTDTDGDRYSVALTGGGVLKYAQIDADGGGPLTDGPLDFLVTENTTLASRLSVTVKRKGDGPDPGRLPDGDGIVTIGDVIVNGALSTFSARASDLTIGGFTATGAVKVIAIRDALRPDPLSAEPVIALGGTALNKTVIAARHLADGIDISTPGILTALTAASIGDGRISAAALGKLTTTVGAMNADLAIAGNAGPISVKLGANTGTWTAANFGAIALGAAADADITTAGAVGAVLVKTGAFSGNIAADGRIGGITVKAGALTGAISAATIGAVSVAGGDFAGLLTATAAPGKTKGLASLVVSGGSLTGNILITGNAGAIVVRENARTHAGGDLIGDLTANSFGAIAAIGGGVSGDIHSTATAAALGKTSALASLAIVGGDLVGDVLLGGALGALNVKLAVKNGPGGSIDGATVTAAKIAAITVGKNVSNARIFAGANLGPTGALGGGDDTFGAGSIGAVSIGGSITASTIAAGLVTANTTLSDADDRIFGATRADQLKNTIASLIVKGTADAASYVAAGAFKTRPKINNVFITPTTDARFLVAP